MAWCINNISAILPRKSKGLRGFFVFISSSPLSPLVRYRLTLLPFPLSSNTITAFVISPIPLSANIIPLLLSSNIISLMLSANYFNYAIKYYNLILFFLETIETTLGY